MKKHITIFVASLFLSQLAWSQEPSELQRHIEELRARIQALETQLTEAKATLVEAEKRLAIQEVEEFKKGENAPIVTTRIDATLLDKPHVAGLTLEAIPVGTQLPVIDTAGRFLVVKYLGQQGYVFRSWLEPFDADTKAKIETLDMLAEEEEKAKEAEERAGELAKARSTDPLDRCKYNPYLELVTCGLWYVQHVVDPMTDKVSASLTWLGVNELGLTIFDNNRVRFTFDNLLTITDTQSKLKLRINKGTVHTFTAHVFEKNAIAQLNSAQLNELLSAKSLAAAVPDYRGAEHSGVISFERSGAKGLLGAEKVFLDRYAAIEVWRSGQLYEELKSTNPRFRR